ncbi:hypothetical protein IWX46DRAFT_191683 [Phyllosticta citricarpa]|uniref:Uncharacterized protein n=1 Tax=Phyllosticta citricarpa TaxID=55181 RepID=A0ABR1LYP4_9PEZI
MSVFQQHFRRFIRLHLRARIPNTSMGCWRRRWWPLSTSPPCPPPSTSLKHRHAGRPSQNEPARLIGSWLTAPCLQVSAPSSPLHPSHHSTRSVFVPLREPRRQGAPLRHDTNPRHCPAARNADWTATIMIKKISLPCSSPPARATPATHTQLAGLTMTREFHRVHGPITSHEPPYTLPTEP